MKKATLKNICSIQMGFSFRERMTKHEMGNPVLQLKDLKDDGSVATDQLDRVANGNFKDIHTLNIGDLVFRSRGNIFLISILPSIPVGCILAAPLMRLRLEADDVYPEFLCWYINQSFGQSYFETVAAGSAIKMISKADLMEMPIDIPPVSQQKNIIELVTLQKYESDLFCKISKKREQLVNTHIKQILQEDFK